MILEPRYQWSGMNMHQNRVTYLSYFTIYPVSLLAQTCKETAHHKSAHLGSIPRLGRSPGGRRGNPPQYSCPENPHGQRSLQATVHEVAKSLTGLEWLSVHACKEKTGSFLSKRCGHTCFSFSFPLSLKCISAFLAWWMRHPIQL